MIFDFLLDGRGYIKRRESFDLEYKQSFQQGDNLLKYIKTLSGMANNKGGQIIFGIKDKPHVPIGLSNNNFIEIDPAKIDRVIREYFSPELSWSMNVLENNGSTFGQLTVKEAESKPVLCKKNKDGILREGAIYFRYRAETKEIEFPELKQLLDKEILKERNSWMEHFQKVAKIGVSNVSLLDTYKGELNIGDNKIVIDKTILDKVNFIKEGNFTESKEEGVPTLKLIGTIDGVVEKAVISDDEMYPYLTRDLLDMLNVNSHDIKCLFWKYNIKGNRRYHKTIKIGKSNSIHKYSEELFLFFSRKLKNKQELPRVRKEFSQK